jgi:biotin carboxylase
MLWFISNPSPPLLGQVCRAAGVPTPRFGKLTSHEDVEKVIADTGLPVVLKPSAGAGSEGVFMARTLDEVYKRYEEIRYCGRETKGRAKHMAGY